MHRNCLWRENNGKCSQSLPRKYEVKWAGQRTHKTRQGTANAAAGEDGDVAAQLHCPLTLPTQALLRELSQFFCLPSKLLGTEKTLLYSLHDTQHKEVTRYLSVNNIMTFTNINVPNNQDPTSNWLVTCTDRVYIKRGLHFAGVKNQHFIFPL